MDASNVVTVLTPPGTGAIAVVELSGPNAWAVVQACFQPAGSKRPSTTQEAGQFRYGHWRRDESAGDEVVLAVKSPNVFEVQCHGGPRIVRWIVESILAHGFVERPSPPPTRPFDLLPTAPTQRIAAILLDQHAGALRREIEALLTIAERLPEGMHEVALRARLQPMLQRPFRVHLAGPVNAGKSSLMNALAGYARSIVSPTPGTTRDVVTVRLAFDGWPVEVADTAGLRQSDEELENAGIDRAVAERSSADLILWVHDATAGRTPIPDDLPSAKVLEVWNKADAAAPPEGALAVSALNHQGIDDLIAAIVSRLVPVTVKPGDGVPWSKELADGVMEAHAALEAGETEKSRAILSKLIPQS